MRGADVLVTVTPARGADRQERMDQRRACTSPRWAPTKAAIRSSRAPILQRARIFVDDIRQCRTDGEINVPLSQGLIKEATSPARSAKWSRARKKGGRQIKDITLFDSTGIALQDSATIPLEYERALAAGVGIEKKMIST